MTYLKDLGKNMSLSNTDANHIIDENNSNNLTLKCHWNG